MTGAEHLYNLGRFKEALTLYQESLALNPNDSQTLAMIANCHLALNDYSRGMEFAKQAIGKDPNSDFAHVTIGLAFQSQTQSLKAERHFNKAISLRPNSPRNHIYLARHYTRLREYRKAIASLETAIQLNPVDEDVLCDLSESHSEIGETEKALDYAIRSLKLNPSASNSHLALGLSHLAKGDIEQAERSIAEALRMNPNNTRAEQFLKEAIRAHIPTYRSFYRQMRWFSSQGPMSSLLLYLLGILAFRVGGGIIADKSGSIWSGILIMVIGVVVWLYYNVTPTIANIILIQHPLGKHALKKPAQIATVMFFAFIGIWLIINLAQFGLGNLEFAAKSAGVGLVTTAILANVIRFNEQNKLIHLITGTISAMALLLCLIGFKI